jgi:hypothetical protein
MSQPPTRSTKNEARTARQAEAAARRASERRAARRRALLLRSIIVVVVPAVAAGVTAIVVSATRPRVVALPRPAAASGTATPPWSLPEDTSGRIRAAGLSTSAMTAGGAHFHPHLDIRVDGKAVPVAANIGVDAATGTMSELHTHDASGIVHIESAAKDDRYALGQLFAQWNVRLDRTHLGGLTQDSTRSLVAFVDGKRFNGDPARIELLPHRQIALLYGTPAQQQDPPSSYDFAAGE